MLGLAAKVLSKPGALRMAGSALSWGGTLGGLAMGGESLVKMRDDKENKLIAEGQKNGKYGTNWLDKGLQKVGLFKSDAELLEGTKEETRNKVGELQALLNKYGSGDDYSINPGENSKKYIARHQDARLQAINKRETEQKRESQKWMWENNPEYKLARDRMAQQDKMNMFMMQERMYDRAHQRRRDAQNGMLGMAGALAAILTA